MNTEKMFNFPTEHLNMQPFLGDDAVLFSILSVDIDLGCADIVVKFGPYSRCPKHRHLSKTCSLVLEGEHLLYDFGGDDVVMEETRVAGSFTTSPAGGLHVEGGGPDGAVVLFSFRANDGKVYEIFNDKDQLVTEVGIKDLLSQMA